MKFFAPLAIIYAMVLGGTSTFNVHRPAKEIVFPVAKKQEKAITFKMPAPHPIFTQQYWGVDESHDFITYDSVYNESTNTNTQRWALRITRPRNYFTANHPDTASRPIIMMMPGMGESQKYVNDAWVPLAASDTAIAKANTRKYGPHYWMDQNWDGGIQMPGGRRYPIFITAVPTYINPRGPAITNLVTFIKSAYKPKANSFHGTAFSMGAFGFSKSIAYEASAGAETFMKLINSLCLLQGASNETFSPYNAWSRGWAAFGHWAKKYNGKFFGLEGTADTRNVWRISQPMNDSVPGSAYFSWEAIGAVNGAGGNGTHCCWNDMYNPNATNWQNFAPYGPNIRTSGNAPNTPGTYVTGQNLFTWMYMQGDTSMVGGGEVGNQAPVANAGPDVLITLPASSTSLSASLSTDVDGTIASYSWEKISGPSATIATPNAATTNITVLSQGVYTFRVTITDNDGATDFDDVNVFVNPAPTTPTPVNHGLPTAGLGEYQAYFIKIDSTLWATGNLTNTGTNNSGTAGIPQRVVGDAYNKKFKFAAGGLHGGAAIDVEGYVWVMGDNDQGQMGRGDLVHPDYYARKILVDSAGNPFNNVKFIMGFFKIKPVEANGFYAIKEDSTLWGWGRMLGGMAGNGTDNTSADSFALRPYQIVMPGGRKVVQVSVGNLAIVLCSDSTVWTFGSITPANLGYGMTGTQYQTPRQLTTLSRIVYVAGAGTFNYALDADGKLYGWGTFGNYMCDPTHPTGNGLVYSTPTVLTNITSKLPARIRKIETTYATTHVILEDSTLWGWGDNAQAGVGNGQSLDWDNYPTPYAWNASAGQLLVKTPVQIAPGLKFKDVYGGNVYNYYSYALTSTNQWLCWGRGKAAVLATGINLPTTGDFQRFKQNAIDRKWPTPVDPFNVPAVYVSTSPDCITNPGNGVCSTYNIPANVKPVASAGSNQSISTNFATLNATGSTDNVFVSYYEWKQVGGPAGAVIDLPGSPTPTVRNMNTSGVYTFRVVTTDNGWLKDSAEVQITASLGANQMPTADAGPDQVVLLPAGTTLDGNGTDPDGTIVSYLWTKISGPSITFSNPNIRNPNVSGLQAGQYVLQLTVTDNLGGTATDNMQITVNAAVNQPPVARAGQDREVSGTSVFLDGSLSSDPDGNIVAYSWSKINGPAATIATPTTAGTNVTGLTPGTYTFRLIVTDNGGSASSDDVVITVTGSGGIIYKPYLKLKGRKFF